MIIDFKNIKFKYIKVNGGAPTVDTQMTDKVFDTTKPQGIYKCFVFPNNNFGGYDYEDVQNLVAIEESYMWDKTNRDTFLGFNEESKEFIINYNAWLSLKDNDLKTIGELPHPSQAGWNTTTLSTTKSSSSKFELTQTDGSKVYLSLKQFLVTSLPRDEKVVKPSISCVEYKQKSIKQSTLFAKDDSLWAKSSEDNSVILVNECVKILTAGSGSAHIQLYNNNKEYGYIDSFKSKILCSTYRYGKKILHFDNLTSVNPISTYNNVVGLQNKTTSTDIEFTSTNNLNDILASGESLTFYLAPKAGSFKYVYNKTSQNNFKYEFRYALSNLLYNSSGYSGSQTFSTYKDKSDEGIACDLISLDSRKPFIYSPDGRDIKINGIGGSDNSYLSFNYLDFIKNIPDGFIATGLFSLTDRSRFYMIRIKNGESVKQKIATEGKTSFLVEVSGSTKFGNEIYRYGSLDKSTSVTKDDLINGTGFTDYNLSNIFIANRSFSPLLLTIYKI